MYGTSYALLASMMSPSGVGENALVEVEDESGTAGGGGRDDGGSPCPDVCPQGDM